MEISHTAKRQRHVIIFEADGGNDKGRDGHRGDSMPILDALAEKNFTGEILFFNAKEEKQLLKYALKHAGIVLSRINPGNLEDTDTYYQFLKKIANSGILVQTHPDVMSVLSFKDLFYKLRDTPYVSKDTDFYNTPNLMRERFHLSLTSGPRVLKKNYTSTGVGVWKVERLENGFIECKEAATYKTMVFQDIDGLCKYLEPAFFEQLSEKPCYFKDRQGLLDVPFYPLISEGEVRVFFIYDEPRYIIRKTPKPNEFSATLFSGAEYSFYSNLDEFRELVDFTCWGLWTIKRNFPCQRFPLIWSIDSIPYTKPSGQKGWHLSDINAAAVGFTSPEIVHQISAFIAEELAIEFEQGEFIV